MSTTFDLKEIEKKVIEHLKKVYDPEIPANIFDLGLIYNIEFDINNNYLYCTVTMTLTSPTCPVAGSGARLPWRRCGPVPGRRRRGRLCL